jgi:hypothetical protein
MGVLKVLEYLQINYENEENGRCVFGGVYYDSSSWP